MKVNIEDHTLKHIVIKQEVNLIQSDHNYHMKVNIEDHTLEQITMKQEVCMKSDHDTKSGYKIRGIFNKWHQIKGSFQPTTIGQRT